MKNASASTSLLGVKITRWIIKTWEDLSVWPGGMIREIIDVPFPLAASRDLISFLTFQISTFLSAASVAVDSDIVKSKL